ncbi:hypothetical protein HW555_004262 [Spodoptera exigua]|uniref:Uncharacterized protein n=1 Tax=Spodoptera exigua TaxID=7107 RepID=A0A835GIN3_SPOEX|nr:hypothetical protein HW555_004262 [Spodoptera exigua]
MNPCSCNKSEIDQEEWLALISQLCALKELDEEKILEILTNCGRPGEVPVEIPQYRAFFIAPKSKSALRIQSGAKMPTK